MDLKREVFTGIEALKEDVRDLSLRTDHVLIFEPIFDVLKSANESIDTKLIKMQAETELNQKYSRKDSIKFYKLPVTYEKYGSGVEKNNDKGKWIPQKPITMT